MKHHLPVLRVPERLPQPLGMLFADAHRRMDALRDHPQQELHATAMSGIRQRPHALGEQGRIGDLVRLMRFPAQAHVGPAGVNPVALHGQVVVAPEVDFLDVPLRVHPRPPVAVGQQAGKRLPAGPRRVVLQQQPAPEVMRPQPVTLPEEHQDAGAADFFAGVQQQVRPFQARLDSQRPRGVARETGGPRARPTQPDEHAPVAQLHIEERQGLDRRASAPVAAAAAMGMQLQFSAGRERVGQGGEIGVSGIAPPRMMDDQARSRRMGKQRIERLKVLQDRRVARPRVLEEENPFRGGKITILDADAADDEAGPGVGIRERVLDSLRIEFPRAAFQLPPAQQFRRRFAAAGEREEPFRAVEPRRRPAFRLGQLGGRGRHGLGGPERQEPQDGYDAKGKSSRHHRDSSFSPQNAPSPTDQGGA